MHTPESVARKGLCANATLLISSHGVYATGGTGSSVAPSLVASPACLTVLELFSQYVDTDAVAALYARLREPRPPTVVAVPDARLMEIQLGLRRIVLRNFNTREPTDARESSTRMNHTLVWSIARSYHASGLTAADFDRDFGDIVVDLTAQGLLAPLPGDVDWGCLRRLHPICRRFGFLRGTPVDRYYLDRFVSEIRDRVMGDVVEIGGARGNDSRYGFRNASTYRCIDAQRLPYVDVVGDAHDAQLLPVASVDCVVAFNVLEHCAEPWTVAANMHGWLRSGGMAVCMVPNAQRLHQMTKDYWRPLPEGLAHAFDAFEHRELFQYGNPVTVVASFMGISSEELSHEELDVKHPDYPVATCIVARKIA